MGRWLLGLSSTLMRLRFLTPEDLERASLFLKWMFNKKHFPTSSDNTLFNDSEDLFTNYKRISAELSILKKENTLRQLNNIYRNDGVFNSQGYVSEDPYLIYFKNNMTRVKHKIKLLFSNDKNVCICRTCSLPLIPYGSP